MAKLAQSSPPIVTEETIAQLLQEDRAEQDAKVMVKRLVRLGWLRPIGVRGAWAFLPPGVDELADPYLDLRGWRAVDPKARFALAGESALWHLGYLPRRPEAVIVWVPFKKALPRGLEGKIRLVTTEFPSKVDEQAMAPALALIKKRRLDLTAWSSRLPALGPEALIVQMAQRPASIASWVEVAPRLKDIVGDVDIGRLKLLLSVSTDAAKQRAAYFCEVVGAPLHAMELLPKKLLPVDLGKKGSGRWNKLTNVTDRLLLPLLEANAKG
jgi:hypothetical protein